MSIGVDHFNCKDFIGIAGLRHLKICYPGGYNDLWHKNERSMREKCVKKYLNWKLPK